MSKKVFSSALSTNENWREAAKDAAARVRQNLQGEPCDLAVFFVSEAYEHFDAAAFAKALSNYLPYRVLLGCNSSGVIGERNEIEMEPAVSILAMRLPEVKLFPFYIRGDEVPSLDGPHKLINQLDIFPPDRPHFFCLADPSTADIVSLLEIFNEAYKGLPVVGGLASGGIVGVPNWLCLNGQVYYDGVVGVAMTGDISFEVVVSQGCRPVGKPYVVTKAHENVIDELAGKPTLMMIRELMNELSAKDRRLAEQSLSVGIVMDEKKANFKRGDFLIRNIVGFDPEAGSLMIGALPKVGQTIQFQVRDAQTSAEDLHLELEKNHSHKNGSTEGAILVNCCGRGRNFYGVPDHDVSTIQTIRGPLPLVGFFANGEIGPIGQKNFVHGYTSSLVILK